MEHASPVFREEAPGRQDFDHTNNASPGRRGFEEMDVCELTAQQDETSLTARSMSSSLSPATSSSTAELNDWSAQAGYDVSQGHTPPIYLAPSARQQEPVRDDEDYLPSEDDDDGVSATGTIPTGEVAVPAWKASNDRLQQMSQALLMPRNMSLLPEYDHDAFQLLGHYLSRTADSMSNGFSQSNPFISQLIPLAFSSDVILQLILTQSAAHRAILDRPRADDVATGHYSSSLKLFRRKINDHIGGTAVNPLILAVGALIMCFTETAKGDINGVVFDHLSASISLLLEVLRQDSSMTPMPKELKDFLVEYYSYTATLSLISIDINVSSQSLLNPELEMYAHHLVRSQYAGSLCGCWLELLLVIPKVFELGRQWRLSDQAVESEELLASSSANRINENLAVFASLHSRILRWSPRYTYAFDGILAGRIFQQALLLYLYTSLQTSVQVIGPNYESLIEATLDETMSLLDQLPSTVRINTSLCWPIAVVGSCLKDDTRRQILRNRLNTMLNTIGLGNMQQTLQILEYVWKRDPADIGPWIICKVMQNHQIWISFA